MSSFPYSHDLELDKNNGRVLPKLTVFEGASDWGKFGVSRPKGTYRCARSVLKEDIYAPVAALAPVTPTHARNVSSGQDSGYNSGRSGGNVTPPPVESNESSGLDAVNATGSSHKAPCDEGVNEDEFELSALHEDSDVESVAEESPGMKRAREEFEAEERRKELKVRLELAKEKVGRKGKGGKRGKKEKVGASQEVETEEKITELLDTTSDAGKKVNTKGKNKGRAPYQNAKRGTGLVEPGK